MGEVLTREDMIILIEAVDSWVYKDTPGEIMTSLLEVVVSKGEENAEKRKLDRETRRRQSQELQEHRQETATLLKAKLIQLKNSMM